MPDSWYPPEADYYVPRGEEDEYPVRQGDILPPPEGIDWIGGLLIHPSCDVPKSKQGVQVIRLRPVASLSDDFQRTAVTYGYREDEGAVQIAFANTFWLPPATDGPPLDEPLFADFRQVAVMPRPDVSARIRAMSHEARVYFIRRKIYFRYRWHLSLDQVRKLEGDRIVADDKFEGPKPDWARDDTDD